jgi:energy-coupling factor transporter ATP-binding protein EcfA2
MLKDSKAEESVHLGVHDLDFGDEQMAAACASKEVMASFWEKTQKRSSTLAIASHTTNHARSKLDSCVVTDSETVLCSTETERSSVLREKGQFS